MNLHYLNADFDVSLRRNPRRLASPALQKTVRAMTLHGLFAAGEGDGVLLRAGIADDFPSYLARRGIAMPKTMLLPDIDRSGTLVPFGWNAEAIRLNGGLDRPAVHPELETVRKVNSRLFSSALGKRLSAGRADSVILADAQEAVAWLASSGSRSGGWVVKADHGNAGLGNRRIRGAVLSDADRRFLDGAFAEDNFVAVEPWQERAADLTAVFDLAREGAVSGFRLHEAVCTSSGALIGVIFSAERSPWHGPLEAAAGNIAAALTAEGYFGPVCFDAYTFREGNRTSLRTLVDLNCRRAVSDGMHGLWREHFSDKTLYWRFFNTAKLRPDTVSLVGESEIDFDFSQREGTLVTSPWRIHVDGRAVTMPKLGIAFIGVAKDDVFAMEKSFRSMCEK